MRFAKVISFTLPLTLVFSLSSCVLGIGVDQNKVILPTEGSTSVHEDTSVEQFELPVEKNTTGAARKSSFSIMMMKHSKRHTKY
ncbi:hypothetical protein PPUJ20028_46480 [Pseudomonas putida]|uniref:Lipoprotein n=1 Tax=Pseudomonas putida TaxID=303 RepID=A0AA37VX28_PSEPU|nr:hypothetical protein PPUJ20028_46480 [Pseudomonas putida]GLO37879.1 hypothetical protein PPUN14671_47160 [Pseudomonas putida]